MDGIVAVLTPAALVLLAGAGYLSRRYLEGSRESEKVKAIRDWIEVHKAMYGNAPSIEDVNRLRADFLSRSEQLQTDNREGNPTETFVEEIKPTPAPEWMFFGYELTDWEREQAQNDKGIWTQLALNERAQAAFKIIEAHLSSEIARWNTLLNVEELTYFYNSHELWTAFREAQATFSASEYRGGTIAPMIYWGEMFEKTQQRLSDLEKSRGFRKRA